MTNQQFTGTPTSRRQIIPCPSTVKGGDPVLIGKLPAVALDSYQSNEGGATFLFGGTFLLSVIAQHGSPLVSGDIGPGDKIYAEGGTLDPTTNVTTGFTLNADSVNGVFFGNLDPQQPKILSGVTNTAAGVVLPNGM
jgi:predicted RecA/RadA family phage recombinase